MTSTNHPAARKEQQPGAVGAGAYPGTPGTTMRPSTERKQTAGRETGHPHNQ
jgi:hypothetical protein